MSPFKDHSRSVSESSVTPEVTRGKRTYPALLWDLVLLLHVCVACHLYFMYTVNEMFLNI